MFCVVIQAMRAFYQQIVPSLILLVVAVRGCWRTCCWTWHGFITEVGTLGTFPPY